MIHQKVLCKYVIGIGIISEINIGLIIDCGYFNNEDQDKLK
jgi:hypothetical protein